MRFLQFSVPSAVLLVLLMTACDANKKGAPVPKGIQELHGIVQPAELQLVRRGTHVLMQNGRETYFLESASVNLHAVEDDEVTVRGVFEANTDPTAAPVLIVEEILKHEPSSREWSLPTLGISLEVPSGWKGAITGDQAVFTGSGSSEAIFKVTAMPLESAPFHVLADPAAEDEGRIMAVVVAGKRALRVVDEITGSEDLYIDLGSSAGTKEKRIVLLAFSPPDDMNETQSRETMLRIIRSVALGSKAKSSASSKAGTATGSGTAVQKEGAPCGGTAGVLCPAGYYCDVSDLAANIGRCKKL